MKVDYLVSGVEEKDLLRFLYIAFISDNCRFGDLLDRKLVEWDEVKEMFIERKSLFVTVGNLKTLIFIGNVRKYLEDGNIGDVVKESYDTIMTNYIKWYEEQTVNCIIEGDPFAGLPDDIPF